ncbi:MAG: hydrogenase iron-sulfur subunit [Firmicutes bacterium]|nr:hydrogenase iron-sulfur subunit [Bacillota bacterium]MTI82148.1 hydrogenase iron-sulfur subunit [Bacillota bacterium]
MLNYMGVEEDRVNFTWVSAAEGGRFADVATKVSERITELGPQSGVFKKAEEV